MVDFSSTPCSDQDSATRLPSAEMQLLDQLGNHFDIADSDRASATSMPLVEEMNSLVRIKSLKEEKYNQLHSVLPMRTQ